MHWQKNPISFVPNIIIFTPIRNGGIPEAMGEENTFCHGESFVENISDRIVFMLNNRVEQPLRPCFSWEETAKIENLIVSYSNDFDFTTASTTDKIIIQELIQTDLLMDRCQIMMAQEGRMLQDVTMGVTEEGEVYTQQVVSRYLDAWEKLSRRRENLFNQMDSTRRCKRGQKADEMDDADALAKIVDVHEGFFEVEKRPEKFIEKDDE